MPYSPSARKRAFQQGHKLTDARVAWARITWGTVAMMKYKDEAALKEAESEEGVQKEALTEPGPTIRLVIKKNNSSRPITLDLTMLSAEENRCLREVMVRALDAAYPVSQLRDEEAQKAYAEGDDSNSRVYRPVPQFIEREGASIEHLESLRDRFARVLKRGGTERPSGELRDYGDGVADPEPRLDESQDDGTQADLGAGVRSLGADPDAGTS